MQFERMAGPQQLPVCSEFLWATILLSFKVLLFPLPALGKRSGAAVPILQLKPVGFNTDLIIDLGFIEWRLCGLTGLENGSRNDKSHLGFQ